MVQHIKDDAKYFWTEAIVFSSKDNFLTKGHIKYLEHELIRYSKENPNYIVHNKNNATKSSLSEMAIADMESFLENVGIVLPTLGVNLFAETVEESSSTDKLYTFSQKDIIAKGYSTSSGFMVLKDSQMSVDTKSLRDTNHRKRQGIIEKGIVVMKENKYIFTVNYEFTSPSLAAALIIVHSKNGRIAWVDEKGKTLKENQEADL